MATLLTSPRMDPALAARVEASVRGGRGARGGAAPRLVAAIRGIALLVIAGALVTLLVARRRAVDELARERAGLLASAQAARAPLTAEDQLTVGRAEQWLTRLSGAYEGDLMGGEVQAPGALAALVARPLVYVRGPVEGFKTPRAIEQTAATSPKDAFLLCLLDPPATRDEKAVLAKVRVAYGGGPAMQERTANAARLAAAHLGLPLLSPEWASRVTAAETRYALDHLAHAFAAAPLAEARRAASARLLLAVMDEPGPPTGLSELDGERPHDVRVALVDLAAGKVVLRLRKHVDPSWISLSRRANYASGLDACLLAVDVRGAMGGG